jgi:hypothetical protein
VTLKIFEAEISAVISLSEEWSPDACFSESTFLMTFTKSDPDHIQNNFNAVFSLTAFRQIFTFNMIVTSTPPPLCYPFSDELFDAFRRTHYMLNAQFVLALLI